MANRYTYFIIFLLSIGQCFAGDMIINPYSFDSVAPSGECDDFIICQNLEATGYDNGESPTETGTGVDPNYTTDPLRAAQSLSITSNAVTDDGVKWAISSETGSLYYHTRFKIPTGETPGDNMNIFELWDDTTRLSYIYVSSSLTFVGYHGTVNMSPSGSPTLSENTLYHIWIYYTPSTGSDDGVLSYYVGTTTTQPGTADKTITNGNNVTAVNGFSISTNHASTIGEIIHDQIYLSDTDIGNVDN